MSSIHSTERNAMLEVIRSITGHTMLSESEMNIIMENMDKTDYTVYGDYPRWMDLERICKEVIEMKANYKTWALEKMCVFKRSGAIPPYTYYRYEFKNASNLRLHFTDVNTKTK